MGKQGRFNNLNASEEYYFQLSQCRFCKFFGGERFESFNDLSSECRSYWVVNCEKKALQDNVKKNGCIVSSCSEYEADKDSYDLYIESDFWKKKSTRVKDDSGYKCSKCGSDCGLNVHHLNYERIGQEKNYDLIVLCDKCHYEEHGYKIEPIPLDSLVQDKKYLILDTKEYDYVIAGVEKQMKSYGEPFIQMKVEFSVKTDRGTARAYDFFKLRSYYKDQKHICDLFRSLGMVKAGELFKMDWNIIGKTGKAVFSCDRRDDKLFNVIKEYIDKKEENIPIPRDVIPF